MGSKFANLNVQNGDLSRLNALCPQYAARQAMPGWVTLVSDTLEWGTAQKEAKRLSKELPCSVLSTEYFDDDFVEFSVYRDGKRVARHVPAAYEGFKRCIGKPKAWTEAFGLPAEREATLRTIFRETHVEGSLHLLSCLLGCPLWVDAESLERAAVPEETYLEEYLARKKAEANIKNQTKLTLLDEIEGGFPWDLTYPIVRQDRADGFKTVIVVKDGRFQELFQRELPGKVEEYRAADGLAEGDFFLTIALPVAPEMPLGKEAIYIFSGDGEVRDILPGRPLAGSFLDRDRIFWNGTCWNIRTHEKEWDLGFGTHYRVEPPCRLADGRLAIVYNIWDTELRGFLMTFHPDGSGRIIKELPGYRHWKYPVSYGADLYLACDTRLTCYSADLEEQWSVDLGENVGQMGEPRLDIQEQVLYLATYKRVTVFDLQKRQISATRELPEAEDCFLEGVLPGVGPIMMTGDSSIQVWNRSLETISRHRTKGVISKMLHQDGHMYLLTTAEATWGLRGTEQGWQTAQKKEGRLRLYELK